MRRCEMPYGWLYLTTNRTPQTSFPSPLVLFHTCAKFHIDRSLHVVLKKTLQPLSYCRCIRSEGVIISATITLNILASVQRKGRLLIDGINQHDSVGWQALLYARQLYPGSCWFIK